MGYWHWKNAKRTKRHRKRPTTSSDQSQHKAVLYSETASRSVQVLVPWMRVHAPGAAPPQPRTITASACAAVVTVYSTSAPAASPAVLLGFQLTATASPSRHGTLCGARARFKARSARKRREARVRTCR